MLRNRVLALLKDHGGPRQGCRSCGGEGSAGIRHNIAQFCQAAKGCDVLFERTWHGTIARGGKESRWRSATRPSRVRWCLTIGPLPEDENAGDHEEREERRDGEATDGETAVGNRLVEKVADGRPQGAREDEGAPEQQGARNVREE